MIISKIEYNNSLYFNLHSEESVTWAHIDEPGHGLHENNLNKTTLERILKEGQLSTDLHTILDFSDIKSSQNNLSDVTSAIKAESKSLTFLNINLNVIDKLIRSEVYKNNPKNIVENNYYPVYFLSKTKSIDYRIYNDVFHNKFKSFLIEYSKEDIKESDEVLAKADGKNYRYHNSSSVYLSKYIDIKSMISNDQEFFIACLYQLAKKIKNHWIQEGKQKPILVCQNLNSSYMASILSSLLDLDILILDKIGPINKLYSRLENRIQTGKDYIIISDVVCLGTEVKIVKNLITYLEGNYLGNASLVRIRTTVDLKEPRYTDVETVYEITKDENPIDLRILTGLDKQLNC